MENLRQIVFGREGGQWRALPGTLGRIDGGRQLPASCGLNVECAPAERHTRHDRQHRDRQGADPDQPYAALVAAVAHRQPSLVEDHLQQQPTQKIAAALLSMTATGRPGSSPKVRDRAPVSRSIGVPSWVPEVKYTPRRNGAGSSLEPRRPTARRRRAALPAKRTVRETGDASALLGAAFRLQALEHAVIQALHEGPEFAAEFGRPPLDALVRRESHSPDLLAGFAIEVIEEFAEADDQVGLANEEVDRQR